MGDEIAFAARYGEWISIKKMSIDETTAKPEIVAMLAGIRESIDRKAFTLLGVDTEKIDAYATSLAKGKRKAYGSLSEIVSSVKPAELKQMLASSVPEERLIPVAESYFIKRLLASLGFDFELSIPLLKKIYPELKIPMPKGNFGKKKKV